MPILGAGVAPAGSFPAGFGIYPTAPFSQFAVLPDPVTGLSQTGRFINQQTKDFVFTPDGRLYGMPSVPQLVLIAIQDIDFSTVQEKGTNFAQALRTVIENSVADLVRRKLVQLQSIVVNEPTGDSGLATANWLDLTNGQPFPTIIGGTTANGQ